MNDIFEGAGEPLQQAGFDAAQACLSAASADPAALWSILRNETNGFGFLADRRPKILFERHVFRDRTGGRFDGQASDLSNPHPGGYSGGSGEYARLKRAMLLDRRAALESASWGLGQVMGYHAVPLGYADVEAMVAAFAAGEDAQLMGCARFIASRSALLDAYRTHRWEKVAFFYNGANYAINGYDRKLAQAYDLFTKNGCPSVSLRAVQAYLAYLGFDPKGIDGQAGRQTSDALKAFRTAYEVVRRSRPLLPTLPAAGSGQMDAAQVVAHLPCLTEAFTTGALTH